MRVLTEDELHSVFGGADTQTATKLAPTIVNASAAANISFTFSVGSGFAPVGYGEAGVACYWNGVPGALSHIPSAEHIRCVLSKTVVAAYDVPAGYQVNVDNNFAFADPTLPNPSSAVTLAKTHSMPAGYKEIYGQTLDWRDGVQHNTVTLFAGAFSSFAGGAQYIELGTGAIKTVPALTADEMTVFIAAHEFAHTEGIGAADEETANGFGMAAVLKYRTGVVGNQCPNGA